MRKLNKNMDNFQSVIGKKITTRRKRNTKTVKRKLGGTVTNTPERKNNAAKKIAKFVVGKLLNTICSDNGVCTSFGIDTEKIKRLFDFHTLRWASREIVQFGQPSLNGFVHSIMFQRENYKAFAVLKSTKSKDNDNLLYEYMVGYFYINQIKKYTPSFLETYGVYFYHTEDDKREVESTEHGFLTRGLSEYLEPVEFSSIEASNEAVKKSCLESERLCILIENLPDHISLQQALSYREFNWYYLSSCLFQVYASLEVLGDAFTHNDLHYRNVLLYQPYYNAYIEFHYHIHAEEVIVFRNMYIAKIIDYGTCYYNNTSMSIDVPQSSSDNMYDLTCALESCNPNCGYDYGYSWSKIKQSSAKEDLLLLDDILTEATQYTYLDGISNDLLDELKKVKYRGRYNPSIKTQYRDGKPTSIRNISDAFVMLKNIVNKETELFNKDGSFEGMQKAGEMHVYMDKRTPVAFNLNPYFYKT